MSLYPRISFFLYHRDHPVDATHPLWNRPLPMDRHGRADGAHPIMTHGAYFEATRSYLLNGGIEAISAAIESREALSGIDVILKKHGAFYHPACLRVTAGAMTTDLVLNVAVSDAGRQVIQREFDLLRSLSRARPKDLLPRTHHIAGVCGPNPPVPMFLGEWLTGFHEFHLSRDPSDGLVKIAVWDPAHPRWYLKPDECAALYARAAHILTVCYDPLTSRHVGPWHHAAGDFVLSLSAPSGLQARLVTVRDYRPICSMGPPDALHPSEILQALFVFFVDLSIRMRMDRLDGVGELVWADTLAGYGALDGFLTGLVFHDLKPFFSFPLDQGFMAYASRLSLHDIGETAEALLGRFPEHAPERAFVHNHLDAHCRWVSQAINGL